MKKSLSHKLDLVFTTFIEATSLITTGASISRIVAPILACACEILGGRGAFAILDEDGTHTRICYAPPTRTGRQALRQDTVRLDGLAASIYRTAKVSVVRNVNSSEALGSLYSLGSKLKSATVVGASLRYRRIRIGAIGVVGARTLSPRPEDLELFEVLARQAAVAIKNAREFERTQTLSITDGLTGAYNYRFLIDALRKEVGVAERYREVFSIIMIDVDSLKEYNDVHGHLGGSEVIRQVARVAASKIRAIDMLCKYGGDEFMVLLPRTLKHGAAICAERLREGIEKHKFHGEEVTGKITASLGIASYPEDGRTVQDLIASADKALYRAKRHGRNTVWLSGKRTPFSPS